MDKRDFEIAQLEEHIRWLKSRKKRNGTKIYYAELRLSRLREKPLSKSRSKRSPRSSEMKKLPPSLQAKGSPENRAYVLSREIYDLTHAMVALERLRSGRKNDEGSGR